MTMWIRFVIYGVLGWCVSIVWSAVEDRLRGQAPDWRLRGQVSLWAFPLFGLLAVFYEPVHDGLRPIHWFMRGATYAVGIWVVEYVAGWLLSKLLGHCPWDYSGWRGNLQGLITWEFGVVWFAFGLALEPVHDFLVRLTPVLENISF